MTEVVPWKSVPEQSNRALATLGNQQAAQVRLRRVKATNELASSTHRSVANATFVAEFYRTAVIVEPANFSLFDAKGCSYFSMAGTQDGSREPYESSVSVESEYE